VPVPTFREIPISTHLEFYVARAEQARADAEAATLDNVRERCRRSEAAWNELADRAARTEQLRTAPHPINNSGGQSALMKKNENIQKVGEPELSPSS